MQCRDGTVTPSPSLSTAGIPTGEKGRVGLPTTPVQSMGDSGAESYKTKDLEPEENSSYSAQVFPSTSDHALRKRTHSKSDGSKDSQDGAPSPKRVTIKKEKVYSLWQGFYCSPRSEGQDPRFEGWNEALWAGHRLVSHLCIEEGSG